jgi:hypothetical protein
MTDGWNPIFGKTLAVTIGLAVAACNTTPPDTPATRYQRGVEIVTAVGQHVAAAQSLSFKTHEEGERVRRSGQKDPVSIDQVVQVRRPDRLHLKGSGNLDLEVFYDGTKITLLTHKDKVYGVVPATGPLTEVIPGVIDRFDIPFPLGDLVAFTAPERLINEETTGGYVGDETLNGKAVSKVAWQHPNLDWTIWVQKDGPPLLQRMELHYKGRRGSPRRAYEFSEWTMGADIPDGTFVAAVPEDYEGIPVIARASSVLPADAKPSEDVAKPGTQKE